MHFKTGAEVVTSDGRRVGRVKSVVLDPTTQEVAGLVVERGFLLGEEKVLPFSWIGQTAGENSVILTAAVEDLDSLPPFEEHYYTPVNDYDVNIPADDTTLRERVLPAYYPYGAPGYYPVSLTFGNPAPLVDPLLPDQPRYVENTQQNLPENTVTVTPGARVYAADDKHVGNIESVFTSDTGGATHMLVSKGLFFKTRKLIPTAWISTTDDKGVYLTNSADTLDRLPDYDTYEWRVRESQ